MFCPFGSGSGGDFFFFFFFFSPFSLPLLKQAFQRDFNWTGRLRWGAIPFFFFLVSHRGNFRLFLSGLPNRNQSLPPSPLSSSSVQYGTDGLPSCSFRSRMGERSREGPTPTPLWKESAEYYLFFFRMPEEKLRALSPRVSMVHFPCFPFFPFVEGIGIRGEPAGPFLSFPLLRWRSSAGPPWSISERRSRSPFSPSPPKFKA